MRLEPIMGWGENTGEIMGWREVAEPGDALVTQLPNYTPTPSAPTVGSDNFGTDTPITRPFYIDGAEGTATYDYSGKLSGAYVDKNGTRTFYNSSLQPTNSISLKSDGFLQDLAPAVIDLLPAILPVLPAPLALAYNVANSIQSGDPLAILSSAVNIPGVSDVVGSEVSSAVSNANKINSAVKAIESGNLDQLLLSTALSSGVNEAKANAVDEYLQSLPGGYDIENAPLPTTQDVIDLINSESPSFTPDTSFTPDYSLSTGAMGAPSIAVRPLDTQYQVGSFDYTLGDLTEGLGLQPPSTPNLDGMGGGQGIVLKTKDGYITEHGFIPDSYIASLGDPESFINKPVVDVDLSLEELQQATPEDISGKLAALDIAKALTPYALGALTKKVIDLGQGEGASGFAIVPVPADWRSPEYNMAFTPSAPINFGSPELLKGTQWENPVNLSGLINTLNQPTPEINQLMTQFQAPAIPYQTGINDIIGNLGGQPVSIADIISGIQSGQTYPSTMG